MNGYQLGVKHIGLVAKSTVALEASPAGLAFARAAGSRVIAVGHRHPINEWVGDAA